MLKGLRKLTIEERQEACVQKGDPIAFNNLCEEDEFLDEELIRIQEELEELEDTISKIYTRSNEIEQAKQKACSHAIEHQHITENNYSFKRYFFFNVCRQYIVCHCSQCGKYLFSKTTENDKVTWWTAK